MRFTNPLPVPIGAPTWVQRWASVLQAGYAIRTVTAAYTAQPHDCTILVDATAGAVTVTLPPAATSSGKVLAVKKIDGGANAVTVDGHGAETIDGAATKSTTTANAGWLFHCDGTAWYILAS